jgi:integrase
MTLIKPTILDPTSASIDDTYATLGGNVTDDGLFILQTKFQQSRLVPLHPTTRAALDRYLKVRTRFAAGTDAFFIGTKGAAPGYSGVKTVFDRLLKTMEVQHARNGSQPHLHDLRHTFAVRCLEQCRGDRKAVSRQMLALSTYLGHTNVSNTYWYLEATPVLLGQIAEVAEMRYQEG